MTRNRAFSGARTVLPVLLLVLLGGCGGDPAHKTEPTPSSSGQSSGAPSSTATTASVPLPDGKWMPSSSARIRLPQGFAVQPASIGGVATNAPDYVFVTTYDPGLIGKTSIGAAADEAKADFDGNPQVQLGNATVDGQEVETYVITGKQSPLQAVTYGYLVPTTHPNQPRTFQVTFTFKETPAQQQDLIDSVLASLQWTAKDIPGS